MTLAPECLEISDENLSPYARQALVDSGCKEKYKDYKLVTSFYDRKNYVLHIKNLKLYKDLGLELLKIQIIYNYEAFFFFDLVKQCCID